MKPTKTAGTERSAPSSWDPDYRVPGFFMFEEPCNSWKRNLRTWRLNNVQVTTVQTAVAKVGAILFDISAMVVILSVHLLQQLIVQGHDLLCICCHSLTSRCQAFSAGQLFLKSESCASTLLVASHKPEYKKKRTWTNQLLRSFINS